MAKPPTKARDQAKLAYKELGIDVSYVPALWHLSRVNHLVGIELDRVCRAHGLSSADINVLGAVWNAAEESLRATDLAEMLRISNAVLSPRLARLESKGLLAKNPCETDRRATEISLTPLGTRTIESAFRDIGTHTKFVQHFFELPAEDQKALVRIMWTLHQQLLRSVSSRAIGK
jgi:DNA-binding MarR family transcriptional regulator